MCSDSVCGVELTGKRMNDRSIDNLDRGSEASSTLTKGVLKSEWKKKKRNKENTQGIRDGDVKE
jgi:hypothetical protein